MYHHHHQTGSSSYDYASYPATSFEHAAPPAQASGRSVRSNTSQAQSSPQPQSFQPSSSYPSSGAYASAPAPYGISSAQTQQWQQDSWASQQYAHAQPFTSQSMHTDMTYASSPGTAPRGDEAMPVASTTTDTRTSGFAPSGMPPAQEVIPRRQDTGYSQALPTSSHPSSPPRNRRREKESPMIAPAIATTASGLDFMKMQESYRFIIDSTNNVVPSASKTPSAETLERMFQSATFGAQMLQSAIAQSNSDMRPTPSVGDKDAPPSKRQKGDEHAQEGQTCLGCNATSTPEWRRGPLGPRTLCNACGLVYAKLLKKRARGEARARVNDNGGQSSQQPIDESGALSSGGSEDEESYESQDRRSEFGDHGRRG